jgi:hypothetical protein
MDIISELKKFIFENDIKSNIVEYWADMDDEE